jgi:hypothetical protein
MSEQPERHRRPWTWEEEEWLIYYHHSTLTFAQVCERMKRGYDGTYKKLVELEKSGRVLLRPAEPYKTPGEVQALLGVPKATLRFWVKKGWIKTEAIGVQKRDQVFLDRELVRFVKAQWTLLSPHVMPEGPLKWLLLEVMEHQQPLWLTTKQVARMKGVHYRSVAHAVSQGRLLGEKRGHCYYIPLRAAEDWHPVKDNYERSRRAHEARYSRKAA